MKKIGLFILGIALIGFVSCRDTKKEVDSETTAVMEEIKQAEAEAEEIANKIEEESHELEDALKELDSI